jgi:hypothetical protein
MRIWNFILLPYVVMCVQYVFQKRDGQELSVDLNYGDNINTNMKLFCESNMIQSDECDLIMDSLSSAIYNQFYTPSRNTSTLDDYVASRSDIIHYLLDRYNYQSYLEIGCASDKVFQTIQNRHNMLHVVGVDPMSGGTHRMTSDEYFNSNNILFDLIFIDGDHRAEQVILDVMNSLRFLAVGGTIVLHDANPRHEYQTTYPRDTRSIAYLGTVWKVIPYLRIQDGLEIVTVDIDLGVSVIRRKPNHHRLPMSIEHKILLPSQCYIGQNDEINYKTCQENMGKGAQGIYAFAYQDLIEYRELLLRLISLAEFKEWLDEEQNDDSIQSQF